METTQNRHEKDLNISNLVSPKITLVFPFNMSQKI